MTTTVTAVPHTATATMTVTVTGTLEAWLTIVRTRLDTGAQTNVRGATLIGTTAGTGTFTVTDAEAPLGVACTYTCNMGVFVNTVPTQDNSFVSAAATITVAAGTVWLKNLTTPALNASNIQVNTLTDTKYSGKQQLSFVIGRKNPVVLTDVRSGRSGTITFYTRDLPTRLQFLGLMEATSTQTLFLQFTPADGYEDLYFVGNDLTERRPAGVSTDPNRLWDLVYTEVDAPTDETTQVGANSFLAMLGWASFQHVLSQRTSFNDLLNTAYGARVGDTP